MNESRYTESQVLFGLREVWECSIGSDDPFDADTRIDLYMKADGSWDEIDFADLRFALEEFFEFKCQEDEWLQLWGFDIAKQSLAEWDRLFGPKLTFGLLARFIAARAPVVASFDPVTLFGRECAPAGAFVGIENLACEIAGNRLRFAPSSQVMDVLRGNKLDEFWTKLRWMTEHSIPELPAFWRSATGLAFWLGFPSIIASLIATWETGEPVWLLSVSLVAIVVFLLASVYKYFVNPLPSRTMTFRELALLIVDS